MMRHLFIGLSGLVLVGAGFAACGDDSGQACGAGTELENGVCVPVTTTDATGTDTNVTTQPDTSVTSNPTDVVTVPDTTQPDTSAPEVSTECTPEEAGKGGVGAACTKNCQCNQNLKGKPLTCYNGPIMEGFGFCTRKADGTLSEFDGVETLMYISSCFEPAGIKRFDSIYVKGCENVDQCKAVASAYDACGTNGNFDWATPSQTTDCPYRNSSGNVVGSAMALKKTCIITTTPPYNGEYVAPAP